MKTKNYLIIAFSLLILFSAIPSSGYNINLSYTNTNSQNVNYSVYEGNLLLVEGFWTGCIHCQREYPIIKQVYDNYGSQIKMLSLAIWNTAFRSDGDTVDTIKQWVIDYPSSWDVGVDLVGNFKDQYKISATPTLILFSRQGDQLYKWTSGERTYKEITDVLDYYLSFTDVSSSTTPPYTPTTSDNGSVIGNLFGSPIFRVVLFTVLIFLIYFKATGGKPPA